MMRVKRYSSKFDVSAPHDLRVPVPCHSCAFFVTSADYSKVQSSQEERLRDRANETPLVVIRGWFLEVGLQCHNQKHSTMQELWLTWCTTRKCFRAQWGRPFSWWQCRQLLTILVVRVVYQHVFQARPNSKVLEGVINQRSKDSRISSESQDMFHSCPDSVDQKNFALLRTGSVWSHKHVSYSSWWSLRKCRSFLLLPYLIIIHQDSLS